MSIRLLSTALLVTSAFACVDSDDGPPETTAAFFTCSNGVAEIGELCVAAPSTVRATNDRLKTVLSVDVDADGIRNLVGVDDTRMYFVLGTATGFGAWWWQQPNGAPLLHDIAAGDFDGDGDLDLAATDHANDRLVVLLHTVGSGFAAPLYFATEDGPLRILAARMNGDVRDDLVVLNDNAHTIQVFLAGMFPAPASYPAGDAQDIAIGDCDANGSNDVMYLNGSGTFTQLLARRNNAGVLLAPLGSLFPFGMSPPVELFDDAPLAIVSGRMSADAFADVVVSAQHSRMATGRSNGNCTFTKLPEVHSWAWAYRLRLGDHDGNGTLDVAAPHYTDAVDDDLSVVFGVGNGNLMPVEGLISRPTGTEFNDAAFGDFNADGKRDLVTASAAGFLLFRGTP